MTRNRCACRGASDLRREMAKSMTEDELLSAIVEAAGLFGWMVHHDRGDLSRGRTQGNVGFPDLVLSRLGHTLYVELKTESGQPSEDQLRWAQALTGFVGWDEVSALQVDLSSLRAAPIRWSRCLLVRPADLDAMLDVLR